MFHKKTVKTFPTFPHPEIDVVIYGDSSESDLNLFQSEKNWWVPALNKLSDSTVVFEINMS